MHSSYLRLIRRQLSTFQYNGRLFKQQEGDGGGGGHVDDRLEIEHKCSIKISCQINVQ